MSTLSPIESLFGSAVSPFSSLATSGASSFENILQSAEGVKPNAQSAKLQWINAEYQKQQALYGIFSDSGNSQQGWTSFAVQQMTSAGGSLGLPAWITQAERVMGDAFPTQVVDLYKQAQQLIRPGSNLSALF
jgi:hypothetical protein